MGMLLRRNRENVENLTIAESLNKPEPKKNDAPAESVKDDKPKTVKRGRPTKK